MGLVLLVRHGQASFGSADYDVLSETGWQQGRLLGDHLARHGVVPTDLVRGGMRRHRETLEAVLETSGWDGEVTVDPDWDEFDHLGVIAGWDGLPGELPTDRRAFQEVFEAATASWAAGEGTYAETWDGFAGRTRAALDRVTARAGSGRTVVVVSSGGVVAALAAHLVDPDDTDPAALARRWSRLNAVLANSSVTRVLVGSTGARLLAFNEHGHVAGNLLTYR